MGREGNVIEHPLKGFWVCSEGAFLVIFEEPLRRVNELQLNLCGDNSEPCSDN